MIRKIAAILSGLFVPEKLGTEPEEAKKKSASFLGWLLSRETLPLDEPDPAKPRTFLQRLFSRDRLEN